jgi:hypothetical protein
MLPRVSHVSGSRRFWYGASIGEFVVSAPTAILGEIARYCEFAVIPTQRDAWLAEVALLQSELRGLDGSLFFEFSIPRMGRRIDVVLIIGPVIFAVEFKVGEGAFERSAVEQVWDYGLDLKNFHEASHDAAIVPILISTEALTGGVSELKSDPDKLYRPMTVNGAGFRSAIELALRGIGGAVVRSEAWAQASYHPTPTIIEAARSLYAQHSVEAIARFDAGAKNLNLTSKRIEELVDEAQAKGRKRICFVTGVPGAGKTLVGLNLATRRDTEQPAHAVFLSGNDPLVAVLREALTRDELVRRREQGEKVRKGKVGESVKAFIQTSTTFVMML